LKCPRDFCSKPSYSGRPSRHFPSGQQGLRHLRRGERRIFPFRPAITTSCRTKRGDLPWSILHPSGGKGSGAMGDYNQKLLSHIPPRTSLYTALQGSRNFTSLRNLIAPFFWLSRKKLQRDYLLAPSGTVQPFRGPLLAPWPGHLGGLVCVEMGLGPQPLRAFRAESVKTNWHFFRNPLPSMALTAPAALWERSLIELGEFGKELSEKYFGLWTPACIMGGPTFRALDYGLNCLFALATRWTYLRILAQTHNLNFMVAKHFATNWP